MNEYTDQINELSYVETPRKVSGTTVKIDIVLEQRMKEFLLSRRRLRWLTFGE